ncbi:MAG TPA: type II toxin-antitoxin system ParD family antitoxin [Bryobacteraceae bacterium]
MRPTLRQGQRLPGEREAKFETLRSALIEGEQSAPSAPFDFEVFIARKRASQQPAS